MTYKSFVLKVEYSIVKKHDNAFQSTMLLDKCKDVHVIYMHLVLYVSRDKIKNY